MKPVLVFFIPDTLIEAPGWEVWTTCVEENNVIFRLLEVEEKSMPVLWFRPHEFTSKEGFESEGFAHLG